MTKQFDVFISHASEDKESVARPLAKKLADFGLEVWFDEFTLEVGDSLMESIDRGLALSRFGVVILSQSFLRKGWTKYELRGLITREIGKGKIVLPIWHDISREAIEEISPTLADKFALDTSKQELDEIVLRLIKVIRPDIFENLTRYVLWTNMKRHAKQGYATLGKLKPSPIRHKTLPDEILIRAKIIHYVLQDVVGFPLPHLIQSFQRDLQPHEEIRVWERIAASYLDIVSNQELSLEEKQWVFSNILSISLQPKEKIEEMLNSDDQFIIGLILAYANVVPEIPSESEAVGEGAWYGKDARANRADH